MTRPSADLLKTLSAQPHSTRTLRKSRGLLLALAVVVAPAVGCDGRGGTGPSALDRLEERVGEIDRGHPDDPENEREDEPEGTEEASEEAAQEASEDAVGSLLLPPRYGGALPDDDPRVLGVFPFRTHRDPIIDGDTVAVDGLDASLRLFGIDSEETFFQNDELRPRAYTDFSGYCEIIFTEDPTFPKFATPMGETAKEFARQFFSEDTEVRLEFDDLRRTQGYYNRYLVYVFANRDGEWINYNLEAVRAGMTPYFSKYGYSRRFHDEFEAAQDEARAEQRGIWADGARAYPDYEERLVWWNRRGDAIQYFQDNYAGDPTYLEVAITEDWDRLSEFTGQEITVFGTFNDIDSDEPPYRITIGYRIGMDFSLIAWEEDSFANHDLPALQGEYIYVRGQLAYFHDRAQFVVDGGVSVWTEP